ncbi:hypothetical protein C0991_004743, partial [Blastosporella zonata]
SGSFVEAHERHEMFVAYAGKRLGENVGDVLGGWDMGDLDMAFLYAFANVVVSNVDMFGTSVSLGGFC